MANRNLKGDVNVQFEEPTSRINLDSGSSVKTLFGRISKWLKDLKAVAFSGSYTDLSDKPTIPPATAVKGNAETSYRTGNVNLTPANIGLGNVNNTSDANKPISTAAQTALNNKADKNGNNITDPTAFRKAIGTGNQVTLTGAVTGTGTFDSNGNVANVSTVWKSGVVGSNVSDLNEKYWFKVASTTNKSINFDINSVFLIEDTYYYSKRNAIIKIDTRNYATIDADGLVYLKFIANNGFSINDIVVVSKYEDSTRKYELWVKNTTVWNAIRTTVLSEGHRGGTLANYWTIYNNFANSNVGETSYPTDGWKAYFPEDDISGKLDVTGNAGTPHDQLPDHFELWTTGMLNYDTSLFIKMISMPSSKDRFLLLGNDDNMLYFGIENDNFVVQTKDANSYYEFKDDGIYLNGTRIAP